MGYQPVWQEGLACVCWTIMQFNKSMCLFKMWGCLNPNSPVFTMVQFHLRLLYQVRRKIYIQIYLYAQIYMCIYTHKYILYIQSINHYRSINKDTITISSQYLYKSCKTPTVHYTGVQLVPPATTVAPPAGGYYCLQLLITTAIIYICMLCVYLYIYLYIYIAYIAYINVKEIQVLCLLIRDLAINIVDI